MARPPRLHVPGACYHVILRGNHREALFACASDRAILNEIVADVLIRFSSRIHAFCWMTNHLHALVQIADQPLGKIMQRIAMRYSRHRHKDLQTSGHLFERRYKAKLVDVDTYFLTLLRYIHLNPVAAQIVTHPSDYPWSSHCAYLGRASIPWLTTDFGLAMFSTDLARARAAYEQFVLTPSDDHENFQHESHPQDSRILGSDQFLNTIPFLPCKPRGSLTLEQLATSLCGQHNVSVSLIRSRSSARDLTPIRLQILRSAIDQRIASLTEVARFLNRDPSTLCKLALKHPLKVQ